MAYWLIKSEPDAFSWDDLVAKGDTGEPWDGVRNHQAKNNLIAMKTGDQAFYYHSRQGLEIVGVAKVIREAYPDPTADEGTPWVCCDFVAVAPFQSPVSMKAIKADPKLADMVLVKNSRLSVQPVTEAEWAHICALGEVATR